MDRRYSRRMGSVAKLLAARLVLFVAAAGVMYMLPIALDPAFKLAIALVVSMILSAFLLRRLRADVTADVQDRVQRRQERRSGSDRPAR
ncbi:hypothetical protein GCM10009827_010710 [Dactylosporangium maewongense]|uniref:DUF4229 domain-containing protein n=2 Tax=Micromonosporaceae TaxID=28056 RepID=A0ABN1ZNI7_9ACTN